MDDILFIDMKTKVEIDIDEKFSIKLIKACLFHQGNYFVLANKFENEVGYFLLQFDSKTFIGSQPPKYLMKWKTKLEIGDASLQMMSDLMDSVHNDTLVVSYKTIQVNVYNVIIF